MISNQPANRLASAVIRIQWLLRIGLGLVFLLSGVLKLISPKVAAAFLSEILSMSLQLGFVATYLVSILEITLGIMLVTGRRLYVASILSSSFLLVFVLVGAMLSSNPIPCGCFGGFFDSNTNDAFLIRNLFLLFISLLILKQIPESTVKFGRRAA